MRAGNLDRKIVLETYVEEGQDELGQPIAGWEALATLRAEIVQASTDEYFAANAVDAAETIIFRTRFVDGVTAQTRITYEGRYFNIDQIKEIGRRRGLELRAKAAAA